VTVRKMIALAAFGLWAVGPAMAQSNSAQPAPGTPEAKAANQKMAETVADALKSSGSVAKGSKVDISVQAGVVELKGTVATEAEAMNILRTLSKVPGLRRIENDMSIGETAYRRTGGEGEPGLTSPPPAGAYAGPMPGEPMPLNGMPAMAPVDPAGPRLPPYAWPTYAPYNNMSRVAYPQSYPYNAFPYIGPFYPFPKVPLGWRKVVLEWEDGHWYYGRLSTPQDYWRVKFW
jgi:BON domain